MDKEKLYLVTNSTSTEILDYTYIIAININEAIKKYLKDEPSKMENFKSIELVTSGEYDYLIT